MNGQSKFALAVCLLLVTSSTVAAQNSSLMQPTRSERGYRSPSNAPAPPLLSIPADQRAEMTRRYDSLAQNAPYANYDGAPLQSNRASYPGDVGGYDPRSPYGAAPPAYDPYQQVARPVVSLDEASWTYQPAPPVRVFRRNDVVTIRVDEITRMMAEGAAQIRKRTLTEAILTDWIRLQDFRLRPDPQDNGDPAVAAETNNNFRALSSVESRESLTFNIAATVVDIRPNGNLVLEARKAIRVNDNLWETALSGICRAEDIAPDNVVLSKDLIDLEIRKEDRGHMRDGYKRGWLQRIVDRFGAF